MLQQNQLKKMKAKQKCLLIKINGSSDGIDEADEQTPGTEFHYFKTVAFFS